MEVDRDLRAFRVLGSEAENEPPPDHDLVAAQEVGVQVLVARRIAAHLDESGTAALCEALEREAQEIVLQAQRGTLDRARTAGELSTAADVNRAIEHLRASRATEFSRARRKTKALADLSLVGVGVGLGYITLYPMPGVITTLGCWIMYNWASNRNV